MMTDQHEFMDWFPQPLSDEAAHAIYLFLQEFTMAFEGQYLAQIHRYIEDEKQDYKLKRRLHPPIPDKWHQSPF